MGTIESAMSEEEKLAFWQTECDAASQRNVVLFLSLWGIALVIVVLVFGQQGFWTTLAIGVAIASVGVGAGSGDPDWKPPEPKLDLIDEEYRIKATGKDGLDALVLIAAFREQESRKAQRLMIWIGSAFGIATVGLSIYCDGIFPSLISAAFAAIFMAWAMKAKQVQIKGFGLALKTSNTIRRK